tara:strand:+ start:6073 stop:6771 length:699 start_codon:yes stop_codon:yes gene_type:complete
VNILKQPADPARLEIVKALHRNGWFLRLPANLQNAMQGAAISLHADAGRWLYDAGDDAYGLYGVISGSVSIHVQMNFAHSKDSEYALANIAVPGTIFGYAGRLVGKRRLVTAVVREEAQLFYIPEARLEAIAHAIPDLWLHFAEMASEQIVAATRGMVLNAHGTATERLAVYLRGLSIETEKVSEISITQEELAELSGLSRKTVNQVLNKMAARGAVETAYGRIRVIDTALL